jgi:hypothetical protein
MTTPSAADRRPRQDVHDFMECVENLLPRAPMDQLLAPYGIQA